MPINPVKAGLTLGALMGAWHLCWSILVALRWAQPVIDFVFWMHFIKPVYVVGAFDPAIAAVLVVITSMTGFVIGWLFALLWNGVHAR
jgi:hypothetical protein